MANGHTEIEKLQVLAVNGSGGTKIPLFDATGKLVEWVDASTIATKSYVSNSNFKRVDANYTLLQSDSGKYILIAGNTRTVTVPTGLTDEFHITIDFEGTGGLITDNTINMYGDNIGFDNGTGNNYNVPQNGSFYFIRNTNDGRIRAKGDFI